MGKKTGIKRKMSCLWLVSYKMGVVFVATRRHVEEWIKVLLFVGVKPIFSKTVPCPRSGLDEGNLHWCLNISVITQLQKPHADILHQLKTGLLPV